MFPHGQLGIFALVIDAYKGNSFVPMKENERGLIENEESRVNWCCKLACPLTRACSSVVMFQAWPTESDGTNPSTILPTADPEGEKKKIVSLLR